MSRSAGRQAVPRPAGLLAAAGAAAAALVVVAGARLGPVEGAVPLWTWFGLLRRSSVRAGQSWLPGALLTAGIAGLVAVWLVALALRLPQRGTWLVAGCCAAPLAAGPPLLSSDVYTYAAQGLLAGHGISPYRAGPVALGPSAALRAVDPSWRAAPSPYGPLATLVERTAAELGHGALGAVVVLRLLALASVVLIGLLAVRLVPAQQDGRRARVLALLVLNPLLLLQVVSAGHFEGLIGAGLLAALVAARRGHRRLALVLAFAAGMVKAPALLAVAALAAFSLIGLPPRAKVRELAATAGILAGCAAVASTLARDPWGWAPVTVVDELFGGLLRFASTADIEYGVRLALLGLAGSVALVLLATAAARPLPTTAGTALLATALLGPVVYPWYLIWGLVCLAPVVRGRALEVLVAVSAVAALDNDARLTALQGALVTAVLVLPLVGLWAATRLSAYAPAAPDGLLRGSPR